MDIGSRIRQARLEAGLSQRQLCGDIITRNMLSLIENGSAVPSLSTLEALARRLRRPMGYFFGETDLTGHGPLEPAWQAMEAGDPEKAWSILESTLGADERERQFLRNLLLLQRAEAAIQQKRAPYARTLLGQMEGEPAFLRRKKLLLLYGAGERPEALADQLPSLDAELQLRAAAILERDPSKAAVILDLSQDRRDPHWAMLRGRAALGEGQYAQALPFFKAAEEKFPMEAARFLEICYRELEDYRQAYYYASKRLQN